MQSGSYEITIIIPTICTAARAASLRRAIASIQEAGPGTTRIIIAANGPRVAPDVAEELRGRQDLQFVYFEEGSSPKAVSLAVPLVDTEYFGFLDDDDQFLPHALNQRLALIQTKPEADIVLSNGYIRKGGIDALYLQHLEAVIRNPLVAFFVENWLPSCGALFRRSSVGVSYFQNYHPYAEWSWLAFRLALDQKKFCVLNTPTFIVNADTPSSLSKSVEYERSYISLYQKMLMLSPTSDIHYELKKRLSQAHHDVSTRFLEEGKLRIAVEHHLSSLRYLPGWRFLPYTRHFATALFKKLVKN